MTPKQQRFVHEYCVDFNATQAAARAGYSEDTAGSQGGRLLQNVEIKAAIDERLADLAAAAAVTPENIFRRWLELANADPADLMQVRRNNCRHCWGVGHAYQWTEAEYTAAVNRAVNAGMQVPDGMGGFDFDPEREPNPECSECGGVGVESVFVADTRKLKPAARKLFAGVQKTKDGIKVLCRDQDAAIANLARCLGMFKDNTNLTGSVEFKPLTDFYGGASAPAPQPAPDA